MIVEPRRVATTNSGREASVTEMFGGASESLKSLRSSSAPTAGGEVIDLHAVLRTPRELSAVARDTRGAQDPMSSLEGVVSSTAPPPVDLEEAIRSAQLRRYDRGRRWRNLLMVAVSALGLLAMTLLLHMPLPTANGRADVWEFVCCGLTAILLVQLGERTRFEARYQRQTRLWRRGEEMRQSGWQRLRLLLAEAVALGFHPFPFAGIRTVGLLMYARLYLLARVLRDFSRLYRARAQLAKHSARSIPTRNFGWRLAAKAWFHEKPAISVLTVSMLLVGLLAYALVIVEVRVRASLRRSPSPRGRTRWRVGGASPVATLTVVRSARQSDARACQTQGPPDAEPEPCACAQNDSHAPKGVRGLGDALWLLAVSMTTVGFGDRLAESASGKVLVVIGAVEGIILSAILISFVHSQLALSFQQAFAAKCLEKDRLRERETVASARYIACCWRFSKESRRQRELAQLDLGVWSSSERRDSRASKRKQSCKQDKSRLESPADGSMDMGELGSRTAQAPAGDAASTASERHSLGGHCCPPAPVQQGGDDRASNGLKRRAFSSGDLLRGVRWAHEPLQDTKDAGKANDATALEQETALFRPRDSRRGELSMRLSVSGLSSDRRRSGLSRASGAIERVRADRQVKALRDAATSSKMEWQAIRDKRVAVEQNTVDPQMQLLFGVRSGVKSIEALLAYQAKAITGVRNVLLHSGGIKWSMENGHGQAWMGPGPRLSERAAAAASRVHKVEQQVASLEESLQELLQALGEKRA